MKPSTIKHDSETGKNRCNSLIHKSSHTKRLLLSVVLLSGLLAGCAISPDYRRPQVDIPQTWRIEYQSAAAAANTAWWEQFQDPALNELIKTALNENRDVRIAAARVEEFQGRVQTAKSGYYPQLNYGLGGFRDQQSLEGHCLLLPVMPIAATPPISSTEAPHGKSIYGAAWAGRRKPRVPTCWPLKKRGRP